MSKNCDNCHYCNGNKCEILKDKLLENCFAWADGKEAKRREKDIENYISYQIPQIMDEDTRRKKIAKTIENKKERNGKTNNQVLDESFSELYKLRLTDTEISRILDIDRGAVCKYRLKLGLEKNKYIRSFAI